MHHRFCLSAGAAAVALTASPVRADDAAAAASGPQLTVTATRTPALTTEVPATVTVTTAEEIADQLATDVRDLVRFEPGVTVRRSPARFGAALGTTGRDGNADFNIRGIGGNRVLIQVDGIRQPDGFTFGAQAAGRGDYVDIGLVKSVEILRGPASALYGSDGLAGAVSFQTADPEDMLEDGASVMGLLRGTFDSASEEFSETAILAGRSGQWSALAAYTRRDGQELDNEGTVGGTGAARTLPNPQDTSSDAVLGKIVFAPNPQHRLRLTGEYLDSFVFTDVLSARETSPFTGATTDSLIARDTIERRRVSLDWRYASERTIDFAQVAVYWQDGENVQFADEQRTPQPDRQRLNTFENRVIGASAEMHARFETGSIGHALAFGGDVSFTRQVGLRDGTVPPIGEVFPTAAFPETDYMLGGLFLGDEISLMDGRLRLYPAVRFDFYDLEPEDDPLLPTFTGAAQDGSRLTPRFGAVAELGSGFSVYGNYAQGFKAPAPGQVNQFFENPIFGYTSLPNPDLRPETSETWEAGARYGGERLFVSATGFIGRYDDFISQQLVGGTFAPGDPGMFQFVNLDRVEIEGLEGRAELELPGGLTLDASAAWATGDVVDPAGNRTPLSTINPLQIVLGAGWRDPGGRFGIQGYMTAAARKDLDRTAGACTGECFRPEAFAVFDLTAFWNIGEHFTVRGGIFNITDDRYAYWSDAVGLPASDPASDAYTQPGRSFRVSLTGRF